MDRELQTVFAYLVSSPDRARMIEAVDAYIGAFLKTPDGFVMPNVYKALTPLVEQFAYDHAGWVVFVRDLTEEFAKRSEPRMELQTLLRTLEQREDARVRRERIARAVAKSEELYGPFTDSEDARRFGRKLFDLWKIGRQNLLTKRKLESRDNKLSAEERSDLCDEYWQRIDDDITEGRIPTVEQLERLLESARRKLR